MISQLLQDDPAFRELCMDFEDASIALRFWQSSPEQSDERVREYRILLFELEAEIETVLRKNAFKVP